MPTTEEHFVALLADLRQLSVYLHDQGDKKLVLARKFQENAQRDASSREYDQRQAVMLDYQHHIWHEIGNMVDKLVKQHEK